MNNGFVDQLHNPNQLSFVFQQTAPAREQRWKNYKPDQSKVLLKQVLKRMTNKIYSESSQTRIIAKVGPNEKKDIIECTLKGDWDGAVELMKSALYEKGPKNKIWKQSDAERETVEMKGSGRLIKAGEGAKQKRRENSCKRRNK